jgi:hypothetical protein
MFIFEMIQFFMWVGIVENLFPFKSLVGGQIHKENLPIYNLKANINKPRPGAVPQRTF